MKIFFLRSILIIIIMSGCGEEDAKRAFFSFPEQNWKRFDSPVIEMNIDKPGIFYNMWLMVDYDVSRAPDELPITVIISTPSGEIRSRDISLKLDGEGGKTRVILRKDFAFSQKGLCSFEIENRSQHIETPGMKRIGVVLERIH